MLLRKNHFGGRVILKANPVGGESSLGSAKHFLWTQMSIRIFQGTRFFKLTEL
jgi:hypothetical protein